MLTSYGQAPTDSYDEQTCRLHGGFWVGEGQPEWAQHCIFCSPGFTAIQKLPLSCRLREPDPTGEYCARCCSSAFESWECAKGAYFHYKWHAAGVALVAVAAYLLLR